MEKASKSPNAPTPGSLLFRKRRKLSRMIAMQFAFMAEGRAFNFNMPEDKLDFLDMVLSLSNKEDAEDLELFTDAPEPKDMEKALSYAEQIIAVLLEKHDETDALIAKAANNWSLSRMGKVDLAILRSATSEMQMEKGVSPAIAINEAVEMAKDFGQGDSARFINGVLDKIRRLLQDKGE